MFSLTACVNLEDCHEYGIKSQTSLHGLPSSDPFLGVVRVPQDRIQFGPPNLDTQLVGVVPVF